MKFTVGQKLWFVSRNRPHSSGEVAVTKIGRKWIYLSNDYRLSIGSMTVDGGLYNSPGSCWLSKSDWLASVRRRTNWSCVRSFFQQNYSAPDNVTDEQIAQAASIFGIELLNEPQP